MSKTFLRPNYHICISGKSSDVATRCDRLIYAPLARLLVMRLICWSRWGILKGRSRRSAVIEGHNFNPQTHQEVVKTGFILGVFSNGESQNKEVWWRHQFYQAVNPNKKVTPFDFSMRLGEKTGMGRALGMPREFVDGNFWVGDWTLQKGRSPAEKRKKIVWQIVMCSLSTKLILEMVKSCQFCYTYNSPHVKEAIDEKWPSG